MSFKKFSASQGAASKNKPDDKKKPAPTVDVSAARPANKQGETAAVQKS